VTGEGGDIFWGEVQDPYWSRRSETSAVESRKSDGTIRCPVTIWVINLGNDLYVRSVNGNTSSWFRGTRVRMEGHVRAGGGSKDVTYEDAEPSLTELTRKR